MFIGSPEFAIPPLEHLLLNGHDIAAVYTGLDKPAGRGRQPAASPLKEAAIFWNLPVVQVDSLKKPEVISGLAKLNPEITVVAAFSQMIPREVLDIPYFGCINIHPSLLPRFRGPSPVAATILAGDEFAGVSVMRLDEGMDSGPVFCRAQIPILAQDDTGSLTEKLFQIGARMLTGVLAELRGGKLLPIPQNKVEVSYTKKIAKEDGRIDWKLPALEIWRRVRAFQPWPGAYSSWHGKLVKIIEAEPLTEEGVSEAGRAVALSPVQGQSGGGFGVGTGDGVLKVLKVQIEGKRTVSAGEFLRGHRDFLGSILE